MQERITTIGLVAGADETSSGDIWDFCPFIRLGLLAYSSGVSSSLDPRTHVDEFNVRAGGPTQVIGIVNVTPDSFSDGGKWDSPQRAIERALALHRDGATIIDVGGESTRPGAARVPVIEELQRVIPVITALAERNIVTSIDTMRAEVARRAVDAGARIVNDVSGGLADPDMFPTVIGLNVPYVISHWRAPSDRMDQADNYDDVVTQVIDELLQRVAEFMSTGGNRDRVILDPGLGFAKATDNNWPLLAQLDRLQSLGFPILIGASRKRFLASVIDSDGLRDPQQRDAATTAVTTLCAMQDTWAVRVHEVRDAVDAIKVVQAVRHARSMG